MRIYSIYKITNIVNSKVYIGFTSKQDPSDRWRKHVKITKSESGSYLHRAIRKYGVENFAFEVIYSSKDKNHTLKVMESHFIEEYDSYRGGYNLTLGGEGNIGYKHTDEARKKMSEARKTRKPMTGETRQKISDAGKGRKFTDEHRRKLSEATKNRPHTTIETRKKLSDAAKGFRWMNDGWTTKRISKHLVDEYQENGWDFGRS